jgi:hypothetical protein
MVVILIISILSALLVVAVVKGIGVAKRTRNRTEITQLAQAVDMFKAFYKVDYIPSRLYLSETGNYGGIAAESQAYLLRLWPKLGNSVDWNGNGIAGEAPAAGGDFWLEGDQILVFFLGGIPARDSVTNAISCTGFSMNPADPTAHTRAAGLATPVRPPFYEFDSSRLVFLPHVAFSPFGAMPSYLDTYGLSDGKGTAIPGSRPYLYFSSYQSRNGYNRYISTLTSDCNPVIPGTKTAQPVWPYAQGVRQYLNPTGFQIISAGVDQKFGSGTRDPVTTPGVGPFWTPAGAANSGALDMFIQAGSSLNLSGAGADDQANFYDGLLGTPSVN